MAKTQAVRLEQKAPTVAIITIHKDPNGNYFAEIEALNEVGMTLSWTSTYTDSIETLQDPNVSLALRDQRCPK